MRLPGAPMQSSIHLKDFTVIDLTHDLTPEMPSWSGACGFEHILREDYDPSAPVKFRTYDLHMQAGMGTHMDAPAHCFQSGRSIADLSLKECINPVWSLMSRIKAMNVIP
jgi:kynurenine formamidase